MERLRLSAVVGAGSVSLETQVGLNTSPRVVATHRHTIQRPKSHPPPLHLGTTIPQASLSAYHFCLTC